jgi:hypothetical protein
MTLVKGYIKGKENIEPGQWSLRSPSSKGKRNYNSSRRDNRRGDSHNNGRNLSPRKGVTMTISSIDRNLSPIFGLIDQPKSSLNSLVISPNYSSVISPNCRDL